MRVAGLVQCRKTSRLDTLAEADPCGWKSLERNRSPAPGGETSPPLNGAVMVEDQASDDQQLLNHAGCSCRFCFPGEGSFFMGTSLEGCSGWLRAESCGSVLER